jgi:hypothetical protein
MTPRPRPDPALVMDAPLAGGCGMALAQAFDVI